MKTPPKKEKKKTGWMEGPFEKKKTLFSKKKNLWILKVIKSFLIRIISFLQIISHQITIAKSTPNFAVGFLHPQNPLKVFDCLKKEKRR